MEESNESEVRQVNEPPSDEEDGIAEGEKEHVEKETIVAGSIHRPEVRRFWKEVLKADDYTMSILEEGYKLPFKDGCRPQKYKEKNNKSALVNMPFAREETEKWKERKVVKEVFQEPTCVSPLTVAKRKLGENEFKLRLCLDLSRYVNLLLKKEAVKLTGISMCTQALLPGDFIATYDLSSAFHHVKICEEHQQYLGFSLPGEDGHPDRYFVFLVMPFGLASAVRCLTRLTKPLCCYITGQGIRHSIYIDDGNVFARTLLKALMQLQIVLEALKNAGFIIAPNKTDTAETISQVKLHLGFILNSREMSLSIAETKVEDIKQAIQEALTGPVSAKTVAKAVGKLIAAEPALGPVVQLLSRGAQSELAQATETSWNVRLELSTGAADSLQEMQESLETFNGYPILNMATAQTLDSYIASTPETANRQAPVQLLQIKSTAEYATVAGDASAVATCAMEISDKPRLFTQYELEAGERGQSSGQRELITVLRALQQENEFFEQMRGKTIIWLTDSTNLVSFLTKGTMRTEIQQQVLEVYKMLTKYQVRIVPVHVHRSDYRVQWADEGSREFDPDDWGVDAQSYKELTHNWKPTVDLFAHTSNTKCEKFYAYGRAQNCAAVDAFTQCWKEELAWMCPPTHLIGDALKRAEQTTMMAILVCPAWKSATYWSILFPNGKHAVASCVAIKLFRPHVLRGRHCYNKLLQGRTAFPFIAMYLRTKGTGYEHKSGTIACPEF